MSFLHVGPKAFIDSLQQGAKAVFPGYKGTEVFDNEILMLKNKISDLEHSLSTQEVKYIEVIKEVPVDIIKEIQVEVIKEVKVIEEKIVEKIVEIQVIKEFPVFKEKIIKEFIDRPFETIKEIEKLVVKEIKIVPYYVYGIMIIETLAIIGLLLK